VDIPPIMGELPELADGGMAALDRDKSITDIRSRSQSGVHEASADDYDGGGDACKQLLTELAPQDAAHVSLLRTITAHADGPCCPMLSRLGCTTSGVRG
jgi:hypothetical protein